MSVACNAHALHPTQPVEIFGNVSTPFDILATLLTSTKNFTEIVPGASLRRGFERKGSQIAQI